MTPSTHTTRRQAASQRRSFWSFARFFDKRDRWLDSLGSNSGGSAARHKVQLSLEQLETRELLSGFTVGDLVVARIGAGVTTLTSASAATFLDDYNTTTLNQAAPVSTVALPTANSGSTHALTNAGNRIGEAMLETSTDGHYLTLIGYNAVPATAAVSGTTAARVVGLVNNAGVVNTTTLITDSYSSGKGYVTSAITNDDQNFYIAGSGSGNEIRSVGLGSTGATTSISTSSGTPFNGYTLEIDNGQLYMSGDFNGFPTPAAVGTGLPTAPGTTSVPLPGFSATSSGTPSQFPDPYQFQFSPDGNTVYIADDRTNGLGGILKWTFSGTTWVEAGYSTQIGTGPGSGLRGLVVDFSNPTNPTIYATTTSPSTASVGANSIIKMVDSGTAFSMTTLATAPSNEVFQGLAFAPTPGLATTTTVTSSGTPANPGTSVTFTATVTPASPTPTGTVSFFDNGVALAGGSNIALNSGAATFGTSSLTIGSHLITAVYSGGTSGPNTFIQSTSAPFTETINGPLFTSHNNAAFVSGQSGQTFQLTSTSGTSYAPGTPAPPSWVSISSTGLISGTPPTVTRTTAATFQVTTTDVNSFTNTQTFTLYDVPAPVAAVPFTPGDLLVYRVGDGGTTYGTQGTLGNTSSGAAASVFLDEYTPQGTFVQSVSVPGASGTTTGAVDSITSATDGMMELSADGRLVSFTGINSTAGTPNVNGTSTSSTSTANARVIGTVSGAGVVSTATTTSAYTGTAIQGAVSINGTQFYTSGNGSATTTAGVRYYPTANQALPQPGTIANVQTTFNIRAVSIYDGQLYWSTNNTFASGTGVYNESVALPAPPGNPSTATAKDVSITSPDQFVILNTDGGNTLDLSSVMYIVDNTVSGPSGGPAGLYRSTTQNVGGGLTWAPPTLIANNIQTVNGLTGTLDQSNNPVLYGTAAIATIGTTSSSFSTSIVTLTDVGASQTGLTWNSLTNPVSFSDPGSTASPIEQFRGISLVPQSPGPASPAMLLSAQASPPPGPGNTVKRSEVVTLQANLNAQSGFVSFLQNGTTLATVPITAGVATYTIPANTLPIGANTFNVFFGGDNTYQASTQNITLNVTAIQTNIAVQVSPAQHVGTNTVEVATLTFTGAGTPTGSIAFTDNENLMLASAPLVMVNATTYTATLSVPTSATQVGGDLTPGLHDITATYPGDSNFTNSSNLNVQSVLANPFGVGDVLVYRNGDGLNPLITTQGGNAVYVDEYTGAANQAMPVQSIAFPVADVASTHSLLADSQQSAVGQISLSGNGQYVYITGYDAAPTTVNQLHFSTAALIPRTIGRIKYDGTVDSGVTLTDLPTQNITGVYSPDGSSFYVSSNQSGSVGSLRYVGAYTPSPTTQTSTPIDNGVNGTPINISSVAEFGDQLYVTSTSSGTVKIGAVGSGMPTTSGQNVTPLPGIPLGTGNIPNNTMSAYFTKLNPASTGPDTLYLGDYGPNFASGTITKWTLNPTTGVWANTGEFDANGGTIPSFYYIQGVTTGSSVTLYITYGNGGNTNTGNGFLWSLTDPSGYGGQLTNSLTLNTLANDNATSNENIRGVALVPTAPAPVAQLGLVTQPNVTAGSSFKFTVTAMDADGNTVLGYNGTVHFATSNTNFILPANATLTNGVGSFSATLYTAGTSTIMATDINTSSLTVTSGTITVNPAAANHYMMSAPSSVARGAAFTVTVTAQDQFYNQATNYTGTVQLFSNDGTATLPASSTLTGGTGTFSVTLNGSGSKTVTAYDTVFNTVTGITNPIAITNPATHFGFVAPSTTAAGNVFVFEVTALDQSNSTATGYAGTVHLTTSDGKAVLSSTTATLSGGIGFFAATLKTAGLQTLSAVDATVSSVAGFSAPIAVTALAANHFVVTAAAPPSFPGVPSAYPTVPSAASSFVTTGSAIAFTVAAEDQFNNLAANYAGTVGFTSSDTGAGVVLPANSTLTAGIGTFSATLQTAGNQIVTATDVSTPSITGATSSPIVTRALVVTSFAATPSGFVVTFNKPFNTATVNLYSQPPAALTDDVILATSGTQVSIRGTAVITGNTLTFVKTDSIAATGTFNAASGVLAAGTYTVTLKSLVGGNGFQDALGAALDGTDTGHAGNYGITFAVSAPAVAVGMPDFARGPSNTDALFLPSTVANGSTFTLIYTNPGATPTTGTATVTFSTTAATLQSNIQQALTSGGLSAQVGVNPNANNTPNSVVVVTNDTAAGANVLITFQSALAQSTSQVLSSNTGGVTPVLATINAANNIPGSGIPIGLSSGLNVTSGSFTLQYNPSLLNITGAVSKVAGATFTVQTTINNATSGTAVISLSSPTRLTTAATAITMGSLLATVPLSATSQYGAKQLLHFSSESLAGTAGPIAVINSDAVQVVAYLGDVTDTGGPLGLSDAGAIAAVAGAVANTATQVIPGFSAFPDLDPAIIGDVSLQGSVNSTDAGAITQQVGGTARPTIPYAPIGLPVTPVGPDPTLTVMGGQLAAGGATVVVPVNIDTARPDGSTGMVDAMLALSYDPTIFDVSAADVHLGSLPASGSGWQLKTEVNSQTGLIGVELFSSTPIQTTAGGSLVTISMHVRDTAAPGTTALTLVPYVDPTGGMNVYETQVSDGQGSFVLHPAQTDAGIEPGTPGLLTIAAPAPSVSPFVDFQLTASSAAVGQIAQQAPTNASASPLAMVEQVFGNLEQTAQLVQDGAFAQPAAILTADSSEGSSNGIRDLASRQSPLGMNHADWMSDDSLAYFGRVGGLAPATSASDLQDATTAGDDLAGIDAFFAKEAGRV
jgi:hypothetical protein